MQVGTEGIILRQVKTLDGRRMLLMLSREFGKISVGTSMNERNRGKAALAIRPFSHGRYELYKNRDNYSLNGAELIHSFYRIGEDVDKYMAASYVLEYTNAVTEEGLPCPELFRLLLEFMAEIERREKKQGTLVLAYQIKSFELLGVGMDLEAISAGKQTDGLQFDADFDIVGMIEFLLRSPMRKLANIAPEEGRYRKLKSIVDSYAAYHFELGELKSAEFLNMLE